MNTENSKVVLGSKNPCLACDGTGIKSQLNKSLERIVCEHCQGIGTITIFTIIRCQDFIDGFRIEEHLFYDFEEL